MRVVTDQMKKLQPFIGEWDSEFIQRPSVVSPNGNTSKGTMTGQWIRDGRFLFGTTEVGNHKSNWVMGYDTNKNAYRYIRFTNTGLIVESTGQWNEEPRSFVWELVGNFPLFLNEINFGGLGADVWQSLVSIWVPVFSIGMIVLFTYFYAESRQMSLKAFINRMVGQAKCPECGIVYQRPLFGVNSGPLHRYQRCPGCKKWHMTTRLKENDLDSTIDKNE